MSIHQIKMAFYTAYLTNYYGFILKIAENREEKKRLRIEYASKILKKLNIEIEVIHKEKIPLDGKYLLISNHKSVLDPIIVEEVLKETTLFGHWISKKELYNSPFFGIFVRNAGAILLDRKAKQMGTFFSDIKECVNRGDSIFIFPEGTRNKGDSLGEFKEGSKIIAVKNRLPILPLYIKTNANNTLKEALKSKSKKRVITVEIGNIIDYKEKSLSLEALYKQQFGLSS